MAAPLFTADDVINFIKELMALPGVGLFETFGRLHLYSGPRTTIVRALKLSENRRRAFSQTALRLTKMIDHTDAGHLLGKFKTTSSGDCLDIYAYFNSIYARTVMRPSNRLTRLCVLRRGNLSGRRMAKSKRPSAAPALAGYSSKSNFLN